MLRHRSAYPLHMIAFVIGTALTVTAFNAAADSTTERATKLYQQGNTALEQKKWAEAESAYLGVWALSRTFDVAANLGLVELRLGKHRAAAEYLEYSLRTAPPSAKAAQRERTQQLLNEAKARVVTVRVMTSTPGARITIDGTEIADSASQELFVDPGSHVLEAARDGYQRYRVSFEAKAGDTKNLALALVPSQPETRSKAPLIALASGSAAGLVVGIVTAAISNGKSADADTQRATILKGGGQCVQAPTSFAGACSELKSTLTSLDTTANVARGAFAAAGVLAIGAVTYALLPAPRSANTGRLSVLPVAGMDGGGMAIVGTW